MTSIEVVVVIFGIMLVLMAVRVPIAISMFIAGAYGYIVQTGWLPFASFLNNLAILLIISDVVFSLIGSVFTRFTKLLKELIYIDTI